MLNNEFNWLVFLLTLVSEDTYGDDKECEFDEDDEDDEI